MRLSGRFYKISRLRFVNILVVLCRTRTAVILWMFPYMLQIDDKEENARSLHECVWSRKREKKSSLKSLSFLNDAHTETMGRRSD